MTDGTYDRRRRTAVTVARKQLADSKPVRESGACLEDKQYAVAIPTRRVRAADRWAEPR
ncbi:hypothetical protein GCM10010530_44500 [Kribbella aluminosa]